MSDDVTRPGIGVPGGRGFYVPPVARTPDVDETKSRVGRRGARRVVIPMVVSVLAAFIVSVLVGAVAGFFGASFALRAAPGATAGSEVRVTGQTDEPVSAAAGAALPSVVNIDVSGTQGHGSADGMPKDHPDVPVSGNGSGVAFRKAATGGTYIVTNNHVVAGATSIVVTPLQGGRMKGSLVGADPDTDIAVVRIDKDLPLVQLGNEKKLSVGALAIAIGSPYGLEHSVTSGVISALHRSLPPSASDASGTASLVDVIQTDAAINPGNSGGALIDREGKLIGINSAIFSASGSNDGIGFAIPVDTVAGIAGELIATGKVRHAFLGVVGQTVNEASAQRKKLPVTEGALVLSVVKGSGAEKAGVKPGDVIVELDSTPVTSMEDLIGAVRGAGVGKTVTLKGYRSGKPVTLRMTVGVKPPKI